MSSSVTGAPKRPPREVAENSLGIDQRLLRDDLAAVGIVGRGQASLLQVAEEPAMARRRPRVEQRPFDFDPLHDQSRALCSSRRRPFRTSGGSAAQSIGHDANVVAAAPVARRTRPPSACRRARRSSRPDRSSVDRGQRAGHHVKRDRLELRLKAVARKCGSDTCRARGVRKFHSVTWMLAETHELKIATPSSDVAIDAAGRLDRSFRP